MKTLKYILLCAGTLSFSACNSWLDEDPQYSINTKTAFETKESAQMALQGCYGYMANDNGYGQAWQELMVSASGFGWFQTNGNDQDDYTSLRAIPASTLINMAWSGMYKVIGEANAFIANIEGSPLEESVKQTMVAEAKFLRALAYFNVVTIWGDAPFKTTPSASDAVALPRVEKATILAQVEQDWVDAFNDLPEKANDGFASKWAAKAFLGKLYYTQACQGDQAGWEKAKACFDEVYNKGVYGLQPKFADLFVNNVTGSKESIFQLNYSSAGATSRNRGSWLFAPTNSTAGKSWSRIRASKVLYDYFRGTYPGDPRLDATFQSKWRNYTANGQVATQVEPVSSARDTTYAYPLVTYDSKETPEGWNKSKLLVAEIPYDQLPDPTNPSASVLGSGKYAGMDELIKKYMENTADNQGWPYFKKPIDLVVSAQNSHKNIFVYRYADMLLMMADVYNELGDKNKAIDLADEVLARARQSGREPSDQPARWSASLTKEQVKEKIYFERIMEFAGEPGMYQIVRARGTEMLKKALELNNHHELVLLHVSNTSTGVNNFRDRIFNNGDLSEDFLKKNLLLPIPKNEIDTNSAINFSDNNFGY